MTEDEIRLARKWDILNNAIKKVLVSQPDTLTLAAVELENARRELEREMTAFMLHNIRG